MSETTDSDFILKEREGSILILTLNRPEKSNALHPTLVDQLTSALRDAEMDLGIKVIVITGAGKSFSAGLDLALLLGWSPQQKLDYLEKVTGVFKLIWSMPQPVIAAVNGAAIAGGFDLAAFCDIRLAAEEAVFGQAEINIGLTQIVHPLYKSIGLGRAKEMAMTGQNISADEAYRIGLANHVCPRGELLEQARRMASVLASKPRHALFETKRLTRELIDLDTKSALEEIGRSFVKCIESPEHERRLAELYNRVTGRG
jgi:enoyl-CoA hydratase/carnithine racemase